MIKDNLKSIELFFKGSHFYRGLILTTSILIPLFLFHFIGLFSYAPSIAIGIFVNAPSDIPGSLRRKINGTLLSIIITTVTTCIILFAKPYLFILVVLITVLTFFISLISAYGFRGSLIAFSGLLAMVIALGVHHETPLQIIIHSALIACGGLWYLLYTLLVNRVIPKKDEDQVISETLLLTGKYLKIRAKLITKKTNRTKLQKELFLLQTQISEKHETLREMLLTERKRSGRSHFDEKRLLIFISLVDIFELALANNLDYTKIDTHFSERKQHLKPFKNLNFVMGDHLIMLSESVIKGNKIPTKNKLLKALSKASKGIKHYVDDVQLPKAREGAMMLHNLYDYQEKLLYEIRSIRRVMANVKSASSLKLEDKEAVQFITHQEYSTSIFFENISLKSPIFRHTLRLTISILVAFSFGEFFEIRNAYWIILTVIVIMRPNYGLTKERTKNRILGTLIGAIFAIAVIMLTTNTIIYAVLAAVSLTFAFSLIQQNYRVGAAFITTYIIFVYALLDPNAMSVIKFRVIDTFIGALISLCATYFLWPNWEYKNLDDVIESVIKNSTIYLLATQNLYHNKNANNINYKVSRKEAFLSVGNLNAAFQRMTQDPKSKQIELDLIYNIVTLNHTFLAAIASLGSFIQHHKTRDASEQFDIFIIHIKNNLDHTYSLLHKEELKPLNKELDISGAEDKLLLNFQKLSKKRNKEIEKGKTVIDKTLLNDLQEAHLIYNQLLWLKGLSENLKKSTEKYVHIFN
ncbi:FUSC family protein [Formosa sp. PL04]|uniref:FUSC family protein n=1 Tax=Formosa sp. PL04 TaxID=3081755 RepID=UPI00298285F8|nr:FUSC family membrane protein [Formosa sp. PL04]MDW5289909.1 FUSC family membrane protein [Formosa sp. PL04]